MSGYSGTPLAQKLGIRAGARLFLHAAPANSPQLVAPLPPGAQTVRRLHDTISIRRSLAEVVLSEGWASGTQSGADSAGPRRQAHYRLTPSAVHPEPAGPRKSRPVPFVSLLWGLVLI